MAQRLHYYKSMSRDESVLVNQGFAAFQAYMIANLPAVEVLDAAATKRENAINVETVRPVKR